MDLSFYPLTLEAIDLAAAESLCLFVGEDERPLTGLAGLADWRLSGRLSRLLRSGILTGVAGEAVLTPPGARLAFRKLFLFGTGPTGQSEEKLVERVGEALRKLAQAGVQEAAMQLPSRLSPELGIRTLIDELQGPARAMVFGADPQKLVAALSQAASRGGAAQHERRVVKVQQPPLKGPLPKPVPQRPGPAPFRPAPAPIPKATPLSFTPERDLPAQTISAPQPVALPKASALPFAPAQPGESDVAQPVPDSEPPQAGEVAATKPPPPPAAGPDKPAPPAATKPPPPVGPDDKPAPPTPPRPAPAPPARYVPPPPKSNVFDKSKRKKRR